MDLALSVDEQAFRDEVRRWMEANVGVPPTFRSLDEEFAWGRTWQARLAADRWVGIHWPEAYGGRGASPLQVAIFNMEYARSGAPQPVNRNGINHVGPTLLAHGTDAQKSRWLPRILDAEEIWCQLFSEPGAGSDLASLTTRAVPVDDGWVLQGQKVWTSYAQFARWGIALVRTDPDAPKHRGLSYLVVDMTSPGIEIRPLVTLTGESEFNEVFFDDVFVPSECLVGGLNQGWAVANTTLAHERGTSFPFKEQVVHEVFLDAALHSCRGRRETRRARRGRRPRRCGSEAAGVPPPQLEDAVPADQGTRARSRVERGETDLDGHDPVRGRGGAAGGGGCLAAVGRGHGQSDGRQVAASVAVVQGGHHCRWHQRDPEDHHRRPHPRAAPLTAGSVAVTVAQRTS